MAYTVQEALDVVTRTLRATGMETVATIAADTAVAEMWSAFPWRETLGDLDPIMLIPGVQDYPEPLAPIPSDIDGMWFAELGKLAEDGTLAFDPLTVERHLPKTATEGLPSGISYEQDSPRFRLAVTPPSNVGAPWYFIRGVYKKTPPRITDANISGLAFPWEDDLFPTFLMVLRWKVLELLGNSQAAMEALAVAQAAMGAIAARKAILLGNDQLVSTNNVNVL